MLKSSSRGGGLLRGGCLVPGRSGPRGGGISPHALRQTPPPVDRQTPVKILPWPNFVAAGKYSSESGIIGLCFTGIWSLMFSIVFKNGKERQEKWQVQERHLHLRSMLMSSVSKTAILFASTENNL